MKYEDFKPDFEAFAKRTFPMWYDNYHEGIKMKAHAQGSEESWNLLIGTIKELEKINETLEADAKFWKDSFEAKNKEWAKVVTFLNNQSGEVVQ